jgi:calcium/calmodulin-dependent protein kinase I
LTRAISPSESPRLRSVSPLREVVLTKEVALKVIRKKKVKGKEAFVLREMNVLKGLNHPNIVRIFRKI